jgi:hypothetical protein
VAIVYSSKHLGLDVYVGEYLVAVNDRVGGPFFNLGTAAIVYSIHPITPGEWETG